MAEGTAPASGVGVFTVIGKWQADKQTIEMMDGGAWGPAGSVEAIQRLANAIDAAARHVHAALQEAIVNARLEKRVTEEIAKRAAQATEAEVRG